VVEGGGVLACGDEEAQTILTYKPYAQRERSFFIGRIVRGSTIQNLGINILATDELLVASVLMPWFLVVGVLDSWFLDCSESYV